MNDLLRCVESTIASRKLLRAGDHVLVAVSGGVDSMVLFHLLHTLASKHRWKLTIAHFNHRLRGRSSDADERLVRRTSERLGWRFVSQAAEVKGFAAAQKISIEMAARKLRHDFLATTAARLRIRKVALAHHAEDQLELFFLRLLRGTGNDGLSGMKWCSPSPSNPRISLIRPLLACDKADLLSYATEIRVGFREDATNVDLEFQRNQIRHELLPLLRRTYQPALNRVISRVADIAGQNADFVDLAAKQWLDAPAGMAFADLHVAVQRRCVQRQLLQAGVAVDFELVERLRLETDRLISAGPGGFVLRNASGKIQLRSESPKPIGAQGRAIVKLAGNAGMATFADLEIQWSFSQRQRTLPIKARRQQENFDAERIGKVVILRHWHPGDRFQPIGMRQAVKLQDLFTNLKIPQGRRHELVVATTGAGEVFWVEQLRIGERFKVTPQTIRRLLWIWKPL